MKRIAMFVAALILAASNSFAITSEGKVGPQLGGDGMQNIQRLSKDGANVNIEGHARLQEATIRGNVCSASNSAAQATTVNAAVSATGFAISNPIGSQKNLVIWDLECDVASLPAGAAPLVIVVSTNAAINTTHTTALVVRNNFLGNTNACTGLADSSFGLSGNSVMRALPGGPAATIAASTSWPAFLKDDIAGSIILGPGTALSVQSLTTAISVICSGNWEEVALPQS